MKLLRKITSTVCALALCVQAAGAVSAEQLGVHTDKGVAVASVDENSSCLSYLKDIAVNDDPSYIKFVRNQQRVGITDFSSLVSHQERFNGFNKIYGIDVSQFNGEIDFTKVKKEGYQFVIIRVGARGYGQSGVMIADTDFEKNIENAKKAGLMVGVYFYTQAITKAEVKQEADFCIKKIAGRKLDLPVYFDIEPAYDWTGLPGRLVAAKFSKAKKAELCTYFCDLIEKAGYTGGVTSCKSWFDCEIDMSKLENKYDIWLAHYTESTNYENAYNMWQFASTRKIEGVQSNCTDQDVRYIDTVRPTGYLKLKAKAAADKVTLNWNAVANVTGYNIYKKDSSGKAVLVSQTKKTSCTLNRDDTAAEYYIQAFNVVEGKTYYSGNSNSVSISGAKLSGVESDNTTETTVSLSWNAVTGASGYVICTENSKGALTEIGTSNTASFTASGLKKSTEYTFRVMAYYNADGSKAYKNGVSVKGKASDAIKVSTFRKVNVEAVELVGTDRYETAALVSKQTFPNGSNTVVLATGERYEDALVSAPMARAYNAPVLLTTKNEIRNYTYKEIKRLGAKKVYVIGGYDRLSEKVDTALEKMGCEVRRVFSSFTNDDFGTAVYVSANMDLARGSAPTEVFISTVECYADMLSVAGVAAAKNAPVLYIAKNGIIDGATKYYLNGIKDSLKKIYIIGGTQAVGAAADKTLGEYANVTRIGGADRYETCIMVNKYFAKELSGDSICVTTGYQFPDAMAGGAFAAVNKAPVFIADRSLSTAQKQYLKTKCPTKLYRLGGRGLDANTFIKAINGK